MDNYSWHDNEIEEYNLDWMKERGKYLTEVIDKIPNKVSCKDIESIPDGDNIICYGPSSGKTTGVRQFIVKHIYSYGIYATKRVDDVKLLRYDILSQLYYLGKIKSGRFDMILGFYSGSDTTPKQLYEARWIICTHERLLIEPPSLLFKIDVMEMINVKSSDNYRKYLFVDEYPSSVWKSFKVNEIAASLLGLKSYVGYDNSQEEIEKFNRLQDFIYGAYSNPTSNPLELSLLDSIRTPTNQNYELDIKRGSTNVSTEFSKRRLLFFSQYLIDKIDEYSKNAENKSPNDSIYYTVNDLKIPNKFIFDGTGDIICNNSKIWNIIKDSRFGRKLNLSGEIKILHTNVRRSINSSDDIASEYSDFITTIHDIHPNERILVYTWKDSKDKDDENALDQRILEKLPTSIKSLVDIITYQSGKERATSKFINDSVCVILGKFFIPNSVIDTLNYVNQSNIQSKDYTISLIVQFLYRSSARIGKPVSMYITDDYSEDFIKDLMKSFDNCQYWIGLDKIESEVSNRIVKSSNKLLNKIIESDKSVDFDDYVEINASDLRELLGFSSDNNGNIKKKLSSSDIIFEYISEYGNSKFKIYK